MSWNHGIADFLTDAEYDERDRAYQRRIRTLRMDIIWHELERMSDDGWPDGAAADALIAEYERLAVSYGWTAAWDSARRLKGFPAWPAWPA